MSELFSISILALTLVLANLDMANADGGRYAGCFRASTNVCNSNPFSGGCGSGYAPICNSICGGDFNARHLCCPTGMAPPCAPYQNCVQFRDAQYWCCNPPSAPCGVGSCCEPTMATASPTPPPITTTTSTLSAASTEKFNSATLTDAMPTDNSATTTTVMSTVVPLVAVCVMCLCCWCIVRRRRHNQQAMMHAQVHVVGVVAAPTVRVTRATGIRIARTSAMSERSSLIV